MLHADPNLGMMNEIKVLTKMIKNLQIEMADQVIIDMEHLKTYLNLIFIYVILNFESVLDAFSNVSDDRVMTNPNAFLQILQ